MNKSIVMILCLLLSDMLYGQQVTMADNFRGEGKIYVVVAVILIILLGIFFYLIRVEKKVKKIEKQLNDKNKG